MWMRCDCVNRLLTLGALFLPPLHHAPAQSAAAPMQTAQQTAAKAAESTNAAARVNGFSGSILVAREGQPVVSKGHGMANHELDVPNTPQTVFRLGSLTKPFTATAILMLQERGD